MKKMLKMLALVLVAMMLMSIASIACAEENEQADPGPAPVVEHRETPEPKHEPAPEPKHEAPEPKPEPKSEPKAEEPAETPLEPTGVQHTETVEILDENVPLSDGNGNNEDADDIGVDFSDREFKVVIHADTTQPQLGETVKLTSELFGYEGLKIKYQWQVDKGDGKGWKDVKKANEDSHTFTFTKKRMSYEWRLVVTVVGLA